MLSPETPTLRGQGNDKELRRTERERMKSRTGWCWGSQRRKCFKERRAKALSNEADASDQVGGASGQTTRGRTRPVPLGSKRRDRRRCGAATLPQVLVQRGAEKRGESWQGT